jgi:hypothetical protein
LALPPLYLHGQHLCDESDLALWPVATGQSAWRCRPFPPPATTVGELWDLRHVTHDRTVA